MGKTIEEIRSSWINQWREEASADDGRWLREVLELADAETSALVEGQVRVMELIPVEEPEEDGWDPNHLLYWQEYGVDPDEEFLVAVRLHGEGHAVVFGEPDSLDRLPFGEFVDALGVERIVIESGDGDMETLVDAAAFLEAGLGLSPPSLGMRTATVLPWNGDAHRFEVDLTSSEAMRAL